MELAEYAGVVSITREMALAWWVKDTLFTRNRYIDKIKSRYWKQMHKVGIEMPKDWDEGL